MKTTTRSIASQILILLFFLLPLFSYSQKVALVLSGGGAKGLSHVGVLKALDENRIPIDYIVGNSMGALVGALYAIGYSPEEIELFVTGNSFREWVSGSVDADSYNIMINNEDASWVGLPFSLKRNIKTSLPASFVSPHLMDFAVMNVFSAASAASGYNFDSLVVPFRCVASEIDSTKLIVLKSGQLGSSVRASTTFPFYIRPIRIDNRLLFDGGMYNNFPADIAEDEFHPDVIIGSKAAGNYPPSEESDIVSQVQNMLMRKADFSIPGDKGILIESKMGKTSVLDFSRIQTYIDSGYSASVDQMETIRTMVSRRVDTDSLQRLRTRFKAKCPPLTFDSILITGVNSHQAQNIRSRLSFRNKYHTINDITNNYFSLIADEKISNIYPQLYYDSAIADYNLLLDVTMSEKFSARFGGNISSSASNEAYISVKYMFLHGIGGQFGLSGYYGRFYSSIQVNALLEIPGNTPYFIDVTGNLSRKDYFKNTNYFFEDPTPAFLINDERFINLDIGQKLGKSDKISVGLGVVNRSFNYYQSNNFTRNDTADQTDFNFLIPHFFYEYNTLNRKQFASKGMRIYVSGKYINGTETNIPGSFSTLSDTSDSHESFFQFKLLYDNFFAHGKRIHFGFFGDLTASNQPLLYNSTSTLLSSPVFVPLPEMQTMYLERYRAFGYVGGGFKTIFDIFKNADIRAEAYIFQPYQRIVNQGLDLKPTFGTAFSDPSFSFSTRIVYHTLLGPASISLNYLDRNGEKYAVMFNFGYLIFNKSMFD
ncbi:MAG: patatin-like phospholipase family protein [Bacteroidales bacterium]|nr:patatin-like phospholipase family protein [Bacteroidales bacterium]